MPYILYLIATSYLAPLNALVQIDPNTLAWFQSQGDDYEKKMAAALRIYAEAHSVE